MIDIRPQISLSRGHYVIDKTKYKDKAQNVVQKSLSKRRAKPTMGLLTGKGKYVTLQAQTKIPKQFSKEASKLTVKAQKKLPVEEGKTTVLTGIKQKTDKPYKDFMGRLEEALQNMLPPSEETKMFLKQLAWENANSLYKELIRPTKMKRTIQDYIKACCIDASQQWFKVQPMLQQSRNKYSIVSIYKDSIKKKAKGVCFSCYKDT